MRLLSTTWVVSRFVGIVAWVAIGACGDGSRGVQIRDLGSSRTPETPALMPHRAPLGRSGDAVELNSECEDCHPEVADEWRTSLHARAFTGREFSFAFRHEPSQFCRDCHAPEAGPRPDLEAEAIGVGCITCHLPEGESEVVLAGPARSPGLGEPSPEEPPHALRRDPQFASPAACGGCHQFLFPGRRARPELMQTTLQEHQRSAQVSKTCADCHMPRDDKGRRSHAFLASRDPEWMRSIVTITAERPSPEQVIITLELDRDAIGHALPTGDLYRRIAVQAISTRRRLQPFVVSRFLARHWRPAGTLKGVDAIGAAMLSATDYTEIGDDRLGMGDNPRVVVLTLDPADHERPVRWRVRYERVQTLVASDEAQSMVAGGIVLGRGMLDPPAMR